MYTCIVYVFFICITAFCHNGPLKIKCHVHDVKGNGKDFYHSIQSIDIHLRTVGDHVIKLLYLSKFILKSLLFFSNQNIKFSEYFKIDTAS